MFENRSRDIAIVDDDAAVLASFRFMLEMAGFAVVTYASAIAYLESPAPRPRCLILDHHMPQMTGLELVSRLRAGGIDVPVMLVTSAPSPGVLARAAEIGVERVLEKPPSEAEVIGFVSRY
jgi:FixJ family two-component response regulator